VRCGNFAKDPSNLTEIPTAILLDACSSLLHRVFSTVSFNSSSSVASDL
jgi:hypothetical protein